jgi:predicted nucleic acid-binding protein
MTTHMVRKQIYIHKRQNTLLKRLSQARGVRDYSMAYYDAQIWATARLNQVPVVFSEDFQDGQVLEGVLFANPFAADFVIKEWA